ncbi:septum site-determining protein MinC [Castellaniella sp.]|uniref:septum site-determining protein MinC n=1 Tax=Castellaniella sp. TaxID=1955812 RepID=UPI003C78A111
MANRSEALDFKSATLYTLRAVLHTPDTKALLQALQQRMQQSAGFYENEAIILDAQGLDQAPDWKALVSAMRKHQLYPIGVQGSDDIVASALKAGLPLLDAAASRASSAAGNTTESPPTPEAEATPTQAKAANPADITPSPTPANTPSAAAPTMVIRHPLRSGQRIYARGGDLIVMGMVSQGAEVIADGHIHVYGPLRGKAIAGAQGRTDAMILTTQLDPELLAIAGVYRVVETRLPDSLHNQAAQVVLDGDTLRIRTL